MRIPPHLMPERLVMKLYHAGDGTAYADSYKLQKLIESFIEDSGGASEAQKELALDTPSFRYTDPEATVALATPLSKAASCSSSKMGPSGWPSRAGRKCPMLAPHVRARHGRIPIATGAGGGVPSWE